MRRTVLVTGGMGYLGGRIATAILHHTDNHVRIGSRRPGPAPTWLPEAQTVTMDVLEPDTLTAALDGAWSVVHLAATNENESLSSPERALQVNTLGTQYMLQAAIRAGVERFIYFSTAHVYGAPLVGKITEQTLPRPVHPYAITHRAAEDYVLAAHDQKQITGLVVRLSNGLGVPTHANVDRWTLLANDLCRQATQTHTLVLRSSGLQQRDFITLHDVGRAVCHLLALPRDASGDGLFNLGSEASLAVWSIAQRIAARCQATLGFTPTVVRPELPTVDGGMELHYSIEKLRRTGFSLTGNIDVELDATLRLCAREFAAKPL